MSLTSLPNELLTEIIGHLPAIDKYHLSTTSQHFRLLIGPPSRSDWFQRRLAIEAFDFQRPRRVCSVCLHLYPRYYFSATQSSRKAKPSTRTCLACTAKNTPPKMNPISDWLFGTRVRLCRGCGEMVVCVGENCEIPAHGTCGGVVGGNTEYVVSRLIVRLDPLMTTECLLFLKKNGSRSHPGEMDPVGSYIRKLEDIAEIHRQLQVQGGEA